MSVQSIGSPAVATHTFLEHKSSSIYCEHLAAVKNLAGCNGGRGWTTAAAAAAGGRTGRQGQGRLGMIVRARGGGGQAAKPSPIFVLKEKPERKPLHQDMSGAGLQEEIDLGTFKVDPDHRSGYIALVGRPNVGKSTLLNQIIGQKLSIVTNKPQTTRHRILGICSTPEYQMILYDTPGVILKKMRKLDEMMMQNVRTATLNADCVLVVVDACHSPEQVMDMLEDGATTVTDRRPTLLVLNKKDLIKPGEIAKKKEWYQKHSGVDKVIAASAKQGTGVDEVKQWLLGQLPYGPAYYPKDIVSEHPERFFVAEIVREKIFLQYRQEIPYACQVNVVNYMERRLNKDFIEVEIIAEKESQKGVLIGKEGHALKLLSTAARLDIEDFVGKEVYLELKVKVKENWRENEELLDDYGYNGKIRT